MPIKNFHMKLISTNLKNLENSYILKKSEFLYNKKRITSYLKYFLILILSFYLYLILLFEYYYKIKRHPEDIFKKHRVFIEAHRGLNKEIYQNTLEAFSKTILNNIEALETDVWITKDLIPVLVHASGPKGNIRQFFNHDGNVIELTWSELSTYRTLKDNLTIPKLRDLFKIAKNKIFINLEIKDTRPDLAFPLIISLIEEFDFFDQISISSFNHIYYHKVLEYNKKNNRNIIFGNLYGLGNTNFNYTRKGSALNMFWTDANQEVCKKAHENGMAVFVYFGMNDSENYQKYDKLVNYGVDVICSNDPVLAKIYRDNLYIKSKINKFFFKVINDIKRMIIKNSKLIYN